MSATIKNLSKKQLPPNSASIMSHYNSGSLAINTNLKRLHPHLHDSHSIGSSGLPSKKFIKSPNSIALLASPPLKKGFSSSQASNNAYMFLTYDQYAHSEKSSGLLGPLSTSSQPGRNLYDYRSPTLLGKSRYNEPSSSSMRIFTNSFYKRIEDFLEAEGLSIVDAGDYNRPDFKRVRRAKLSCIKLIQEADDSEEPEMVRSACESPKLISDSLTSSNLFQRRASHSQAPLKSLALNGEDSPVQKKKPSRLDIRMRSPIMEKDTPLSYRVSSRGSVFNTPASMQGFVFFGHLQSMEKARAVSKDCSPEIREDNREMRGFRGAQSVHGKKSNGGFFKGCENQLCKDF